MGRLAYSLSHQNKSVEAESLYLAALQQLQASLGPEDAEVMKCVDGLGFTCFLLKKLEDSEKYYRRLLQYYEKTLGEEHLNTLKTVNNLGKTYQSLGKYNEAIKLCEGSLECCQRTLGLNHPTTQAAVVTLAQIRHYLNDSATAEQMYRMALSCNEKTLGPNHEDTLVIVCHIASLLSDQGLYSASEMMYVRALAGYEETVGGNSLLALQALHNIGVTLLKQIKPIEARVQLNKAYEGRVKYLGENHGLTLTTLFQIGQSYHLESAWRHRPDSKDKRVLAEQTLYRALAGCDVTLGPQHTQSVEVAQYLADFLIEQNNPLPGEPLYRRIYQVYKTTLDRSRDTRISQAAHRLGYILDIKRDHEEAAEYFLIAHEAYKKVRVLDPLDPVVVSARFTKMQVLTSEEEKNVLVEDALDQHKNSLWRLAHG